MINIIKTTKLSKKEKIIIYGEIAAFHPDLHIALVSAKKSLLLAEEINDIIPQARALNEISIIERSLGNNNLSTTAALKALQIYEKLNFNNEKAISYIQIASNYTIERDYDSAISYLKKAIKIYKKNDEYDYLPHTINNLGEVYRLSGNIDSAISSFKESISLFNIKEDEFSKMYAVGNLGMAYSTQNKLALAKEHLTKAIKALQENEDYNASVYMAELGQVYRKEKNNKLCEEKLLEAFAIADKNGLKEQIRDFSKMLTSLYEENKDYPNALRYQKFYQVYQDSLVNKDNIKKLEQLKAGYEIDKRETEIGLLSTINANQKKWMITLFIGLFLLLAFLYLLYRGNQKIRKANHLLGQQKEEISKKEKEKALLLRELNHRVKNNLQMIASLLNLQSNKLSGHPAQEAIITGRQRVEALSLVHRKLYQEGVDTRISVKEYISELILGLFHGFDADFKPEFDIADVSINIDAAIPLALIVNEIVINALKYAYHGIDNPALKISIHPAKDGRLTINISDNGIGFSDIDSSKKTNSLGLKIINSLIMQLEGKINKTNDNGTHWEMNVKAA